LPLRQLVAARADAEREGQADGRRRARGVRGVTQIEATLVEAITSRRVVEFDYRRLMRIAEPHTLGINTSGVEQLLAYQIRGKSSSGPLPDWRRFDVDDI